MAVNFAAKDWAGQRNGHYTDRASWNNHRDTKGSVMTELDLVVSAMKNIQNHSELWGGRFLALTHSLEVAVLFVDGAGRITVANDTVLRLLGGSGGDVVGRTTSDFLGQLGDTLTKCLSDGSCSLQSEPLDGYLTDLSRHHHKVSVLVHPVNTDGTAPERAMLLVVSDHKRHALVQALSRAGSSYDYLANFLLMARDDERKRIASDLHDGLGQVLTMLKFRVEDALIRLGTNRVDESQAILHEVVQELRGAVGEVRRISTELRPSMLDDLGLLPTLQWFARQFEAAHAGVKVTLDIRLDEESIPVTIKTSVFRLIQEAMNNVAKHAQATSVFIYLRVYRGAFMVGVVDNGIGFEAGRVLAGQACLLGVGLNSMRERVEASGGTFKIKSHAGSGTSVSAIWGEPEEDFAWTGAALLTERAEPSADAAAGPARESANDPGQTPAPGARGLKIDVDLTR
jgi:two-component system, NarL family, sensor kinase